MKKYSFLLLALLMLGCSGDPQVHWTGTATPAQALTPQYKEIIKDDIIESSSPSLDTCTLCGVLHDLNTFSSVTYPTVRGIFSQRYYVMLQDSCHYATFAHPLLSGLRLGDTIAVTGMPYTVPNRFAILPLDIRLIAPYQAP